MPMIYLKGPEQYDYAKLAIERAPVNSTVSILKPTRTPPQNRKMWAMLHDVSVSEVEDRKWTRDQWKIAFMDSLGHQCQFTPGLDGAGFLPMGYRTSKLTVPEMSDLIEVIYEYGARHGVTWRETDRSGFGRVEA